MASIAGTSIDNMLLSYTKSEPIMTSAGSGNDEVSTQFTNLAETDIPKVFRVKLWLKLSSVGWWISVITTEVGVEYSAMSINYIRESDNAGAMYLQQWLELHSQPPTQSRFYPGKSQDVQKDTAPIAKTQATQPSLNNDNTVRHKKLLISPVVSFSGASSLPNGLSARVMGNSLIFITVDATALPISWNSCVTLLSTSAPPSSFTRAFGVSGSNFSSVAVSCVRHCSITSLQEDWKASVRTVRPKEFLDKTSIEKCWERKASAPAWEFCAAQSMK